MARAETRERRGPKVRDRRVEGLKRRVIGVAQLDGEVVSLREGLFLVRATKVTYPHALVMHVRREGVLDLATLEWWVALEQPPVRLDAARIAAAHHDLRILSEKESLREMREHRRPFARWGAIDLAWVEARRARVAALASLLLPHHDRRPPKEEWFDRVVEIVAAVRGRAEADVVAEVGTRIRALPFERRRVATERLDAVVASLETGRFVGPSDLVSLAERLEAARDLPGRARRRRVLETLRRVVEFPEAPASLVATVGDPDARATFVTRVASAGRAMAEGLPAFRDPSIRDKALELVARLALAFRIDDDGIPLPPDAEVDAALAQLDELNELAVHPISLAKAVALGKIAMKRVLRRRFARWIAEGLPIELVAEAAKHGHLDAMFAVPNARAARAYGTWAIRLSAHYGARGMRFELSPELFANLPKNEDLAVLAMCLMEQVAPKKAAADAPPIDPIATLDATIALFQSSPDKAKGLLASLKDVIAFEGRRLFPAFAAWLGDDALLDRALHFARIAGDTTLLPRAIREDFEHAARAHGERVHLEKLSVRSAPQQGRLDALRRAERTLEGSPKGRTRRRLATRIDRLMPIAYKKQLDVTFREILAEVWQISVPSLTSAWRDVVRFWLAVKTNRDLLGRLLQAAARSPGRDVKGAFAKNVGWIDAARKKIAVDAWLAPRRRDLVVEREGAAPARFVLELEEDPLEVLRMGIPFATCLSLEGGVNAASTVLNAVDANKRVLYVRNARGAVVARKLLAISGEHRIVGYNLYVSVKGPEEIAIRRAVFEASELLARETGAPLASTGTPARIHPGFWYDDGTVSFEQDDDVVAYCKSLALEPPATRWDELETEARAWRARESADVAAAIHLLSAYDDGRANRAIGAWIVEHLGLRAAERRALGDASVQVALGRALAGRDEAGLLRAIDLAVRVETPDGDLLDPLVASFPPSAKIAAALVEMGLRAKRRHDDADDGLCARTLNMIPETLEDVAGALDVLDAIEPVWHFLRDHVLMNRGLELSARAVEAIFDRAPDPDVVVAALMSRRRTHAAQHAALRVAARHLLPNGDRALARLARLRPDLATSGWGLAAFVRQARVDRVSPALARRAPIVQRPPFEELGDLLVGVEGIDALLGDTRVAALDAWKPGSWELAWRRRRPDDEVRSALFDRAAETPRAGSAALELLAQLADLERIGALAHVVPNRYVPRAATPPKAPAAPAPLDCRRSAISLARQVEAAGRGLLAPEIGAPPVVDAMYATLARQALLETRDDDLRDHARAVVVRCRDGAVVDWQRLIGRAADRDDVATVRSLVEAHHGSMSPRLVVDVWQLPDAHDALVQWFAARRGETWAPEIRAAEREASARGLSVEGLLDRVAVALVERKAYGAIDRLDGRDAFRSAVNAIVREATPLHAAATYAQVEDALTASIFVRAIERLPLDRAAALREAGRRALAPPSPRCAALAAWLESTRVYGMHPAA